jgi:hypothetical protein
MAKAAVLNIDIIATAEKAIGAFEKIKEKSGASFSALKIGAIAAAGAVIAGLGEATKAASEHEVNVAKLAQAYRDAGVSTKGMGGALEEIEARSRRTGQSTEDNIAAYTKLVAATHSSAKAHEELATAEDLAAFKGISVSDAAQAITSAQAGNTRALKEMGLATKDAAGHQLSATAIMNELTKAVHGQADAVGNTAAGQMARYKESLDQTKVAIGEALLPVMGQLLKILQPVFAWMAKNAAIVKVVALAAGALAAVIVTVSAVTKVWAAVEAILNAILFANPLDLIIVGIAALAIGVVLVVKHWRDFQGIINAVWGALKVVGAWIMAHWKIIVDILLGPIGILLTNLGTVKQVLFDIVHALEDVGHAVSKALGWLGKLPKSAGGILSKIPFALPGPAPGPAPTTMVFQITATPGADLPETVYQALRDYQRRHVRPELRPIFGR